MSDDKKIKKPDSVPEAPERISEEKAITKSLEETKTPDQREKSGDNPYAFDGNEPVFNEPDPVDNKAEKAPVPKQPDTPEPLKVPEQQPAVTEPDPAAVAAAAAMKQNRRKRYARVVRTYFTIAVIGGLMVATYAYKDKIGQLTGKQICSYNALGPYGTAPADVLKKRPADDKQYADALNAARKLFWAGDKAAISAYEELIEKFRNKPEAVGELGNVYFKHGQNTKAAKAWYDAGISFLEQKRPTRTKQLVEILKQLDAELAAKLQQKLTNASK